MNYSDWITQVTSLLDISFTVVPANLNSLTPTSEPNFNVLIPAAISFTELAMQRSLDLISTTVTNETGTLASGNRNMIYPTNSGIFVVVEQFWIIVNGVRQRALTPVAVEFLDECYPSDLPLTPGPSIPQYIAPINDTGGLVGPAPDSNYGFGIRGTQRFVPLSPSAPTNFLTLNLPDLYLAKSMQWWAGNYQRDYGTQGDDKSLPTTWESLYDKLLKDANIEEWRKEFRSAGWSPRSPSPLAMPPQS